MGTENKGNNWFLLALLGLALGAFGVHAYKTHQKQRLVDRSPIAVAAVRGAAGENSAAAAGAPNATVDYVKSMQSDVDTAQRAVDKYNAINKSHSQNMGHSPE